jgi:hypothetical protein
LPLKNFSILTALFQGIARVCLYEFGMHSGKGKSSFACATLVLSAIEQGEKICIIANEEGIESWMNLLITTILKYMFDYGFDRQRWLQGRFSDEEKEMLNKAVEYLEDVRNKELLIFAPLQTYKMDIVKKIIKKHTFLGCNYYVFDTFKQDKAGNNDGNGWQAMMNNAMDLYDICKPVENGGLNIGLFVTFQLSKLSLNKRYLDEGDFGISKGIIDCASVAVLSRAIRPDERTGGKYPLEVYKYENDQKVIVKLSDKKTYYIFWIVKNRRGKTNPYQVVAEVSLDHNYFNEIGMTFIPTIE